MPVDELVVEDVIAENDAMVVHRGRWRGQPIWIQVVRGDHAEARIAIRPRVAHAVLPPVLAEGRLADGRPYLVLPALEGEDLAVRLRRGPLSVPDGLAVVDSVGGALAALHDAGLLHRDLRPESIFFRSMAGVQLLDAGLVHAAAGSGRLRGAHDHLAPERLFGEPATVASEVYELAALLWIALAQKLPWPSATGPAGRRGVPPLPVPEAGAALDAVVRRALSTVPERRPPSVSAFLDELRAATLAPAGPVEERRTHDVRPLPAEPDVSSVVGDTYRLLRILGRGGCGAVYEAEHLRLPRRFAIKMLRPGDGESAQLRFRREAEIIAALDHPHIVQVYDYDVDEGGSPFMVMELLEGETLRQRLQRGPLDLDEVLAMLGQVADAVEAAHARGVIHRDIKPHNLLLSRDGTLKLLDFGVATAPERDVESPLTSTGVIVGSPAPSSRSEP